MLDTALTVLFITFFFAAIFFLLPEAWRWLAARNVHRRRALERAAAAHFRSLRQAAGRLRPYRDLKAAIYRERYAAARQHVARADDLRQQSVRRLESLSLPQPPAGAWSFPHFLQHPGDLLRIPRDTYRLWELGRLLQEERAALAQAEIGLKQLQQTPADLLERCRALAEERLPRLGDDLRAESQEGMTALSDMATRLQHLKQRAMALERELAAGLHEAAPPDEALAATDARAQLLDEVAAAAGALETDLKAVQAERRALDEALEAAVEARSQLPPAEEQPALSPLLARADERLAEAAALRSERAFADAGERVQDARTLLDTAATMARAADQGKAAADRAKYALDREPYADLGRRLEEAVAAAHHLGEPGLAGEETPVVDVDAAADLRRRFDELSSEARRLQEAYEADRQRLQEEADRQAIRLRRARQALETKLSLSPAEPLLARTRDVLGNQEAAIGRPAALRAFVEDASALARSLEEAATEVDVRLSELEKQRESLSERLARAEQQAAQWRSLHPHVETMRECAAGLWQIGPHADKLATVYGDMADGRALYAQAIEASEALKADRQRLATLERRIDLVRGRLENHAEEFDPATLQRVTGLADDYVTEARRTASVEEAAAALDEAYDVLKRLAAS